MLSIAAAAAVHAVDRAQTTPSGSAPAQPVAPGKAHPEIPDTEAATCLTCHEDVGKGTVVHAPVEGGLCASCHEFAGTGDATTVALAGGATPAAVSALCLTCHDSVADAMKAAVPHAPVQSGECLTCHAPHASAQRGLLKAAAGELCGTCHDAVAESLKMKSVHAPAAAGCSTCHNPHGSANGMLLREVPNALCQACHSVPVPVPGMPPPAAITIGGSVTVGRADLPLAKQTSLDAAGRGHPLTNHPTSGRSDPLKKDRPFTCLSCHAPHGSGSAKLMGFDLAPGEGVCQKCHEM